MNVLEFEWLRSNLLPKMRMVVLTLSLFLSSVFPSFSLSLLSAFSPNAHGGCWAAIICSVLVIVVSAYSQCIDNPPPKKSKCLWCLLQSLARLFSTVSIFESTSVCVSCVFFKSKNCACLVQNVYKFWSLIDATKSSSLSISKK